MIFDSLANLGFYFRNKAFQEKITEFISQLNADTEEQKYELIGKDLMAIVSHYDTRQISDGVFESHREYIDLQMLVNGTENILIGQTDNQKVKEIYNPDRDAEFYDIEGKTEVTIGLEPGVFALFFPQDAHMPCICRNGIPAPVKKCVFKIKTELF